ncbi:type II CAAX endopeptidase family protein [Brevibacterium sp.]|uniref:CPBP family intramembrane glutamic endopeptidase n=1 Tax=Brevibacterium sp. TaxID=1701 RepID=UPI002810D3C9|nr:type II CAAX endopeptidase family protein [Brevibacterium sp.]
MDKDLAADRGSSRRFGIVSWPGCAALLLAAAAVVLFGIGTSAPHWRPLGYVPMLVSVLVAWWAQREFGRDLTIIAACLALISSISVEADISWTNIARMGAVLSAVVIGPWLVTRHWFGDDTIVFPRRKGQRWSRLEWSWLLFVIIVAWLILPVYFMGTGVYRNWPPVTEWHEIVRLFFGVNAVGIWDELFFICTVFALLRKHFEFWSANVVTSIIFVAFLWELGYRSVGPLLTIPFALMQAFIFTRTKSLPYTIAVHLLFDAIVFLTIVAAHHPQLRWIFPWF